MKKNIRLYILVACIGFANIMYAQAWQLAGNNLTGTEKLGSKNAFDLNLITKNIKRMTIKADGKIGFGTTDPVTRFNFYGLTRIDDSLGTSLLPLLILNGRSNNATIELRTNDTLKTIFGYDQSTNRFNVNVTSPYISSLSVHRGTGDVLIGNSVLPSSKINVFGNFLGFNAANAIGASHIVFKDPNTIGYGGMYIDMAAGSGRKPFYGYALSGSAKMWTYYDEATSQWRVFNGADRMVITNPRGYVGIGTTAPVAKLHVDGGFDAGLGGGGFIVAGPLAGKNIDIDDDEIMARNNGAVSTLFLNNEGGLIHTGGDLDVGGFNVSFGSIETLSDAGPNTISSNSNFVPTITNMFTLGVSSLRWNAAWLSGGVITGSDARIKKNIRDLNYGLNEIMQLRSVKYNLKEGIDQNDKFGVIAQEIQKVIPEVVVDYDIVTNEKTRQATKVPSAILGVRYTDLIPVLIKAIQELKQEIDQLKQTQVNPGSNNNAIVLSNAMLEQNAPNPVRNTTVIHYNVSGNAQLVVTDQNGKTIKQLQVNGSSSITVDCTALSAGTYTYILLSEGKIIDSKKMMVIK